MGVTYQLQKTGRMSNSGFLGYQIINRRYFWTIFITRAVAFCMSTFYTGVVIHIIRIDKIMPSVCICLCWPLYQCALILTQLDTSTDNTCPSSFRMRIVVSHFTGELIPRAILWSLMMPKQWGRPVENHLHHSPKVYLNHNEQSKIITSISFVILPYPLITIIRWFFHRQVSSSRRPGDCRATSIHWTRWSRCRGSTAKGRCAAQLTRSMSRPRRISPASLGLGVLQTGLLNTKSV